MRLGVEDLPGEVSEVGCSGDRTEGRPVGGEAQGGWRAETPAPVGAPCCLAVWPWAVDLPSLNSDSLYSVGIITAPTHRVGVRSRELTCWVCSLGFGPEKVLRERSS